jgi:hypothetical protein
MAPTPERSSTVPETDSDGSQKFRHKTSSEETSESKSGGRQFWKFTLRPDDDDENQ